MSENKEITIINNYPPEKYNSLIPVKTIQELSPLHKIVFNEVMISSNLSDKDVYKQGNELALTKKALEKLMIASNIQIVESMPITPKVCRKCIEIAKATKLAPKCGECASRNDVAYRVTVSIPDSNGGLRYVQASKNSKYEDTKSANEKLFLDEQCETKALNRALRKAMTIKSTYTVKELEKPFVVANVVIDMADADIKKAMITRCFESSNILFGKNTENKMLNAPIEVIPEDEEERQYQDENIQDTSYVEDKLICEECNKEIAATDKASAEEIANYTKVNFKRQLCSECFMKENEKLKQKMGGK